MMSGELILIVVLVSAVGFLQCAPIPSPESPSPETKFPPTNETSTAESFAIEELSNGTITSKTGIKTHAPPQEQQKSTSPSPMIAAVDIPEAAAVAEQNATNADGAKTSLEVKINVTTVKPEEQTRTTSISTSPMTTVAPTAESIASKTTTLQTSALPKIVIPHFPSSGTQGSLSFIAFCSAMVFYLFL